MEFRRVRFRSLEFKQKIRKLRAVRPGISISSDFIVGFPGETDADFDKTMKLIEEVGFDQSFSFIYSRRPGTPAADLEDSASSEEKHARLARLQAHINADRKSTRLNSSHSCAYRMPFSDLKKKHQKKRIY